MDFWVEATWEFGIAFRQSRQQIFPGQGVQVGKTVLFFAHGKICKTSREDFHNYLLRVHGRSSFSSPFCHS